MGTPLSMHSGAIHGIRSIRSEVKSTKERSKGFAYYIKRNATVECILKYSAFSLCKVEKKQKKHLFKTNIISLNCAIHVQENASLWLYIVVFLFNVCSKL